MKRALVVVVGIAAVTVAAVLIYRYFSPHHYCVRYYTAEATESGLTGEAAESYALGLCTSKNPFRN